MAKTPRKASEAAVPEPNWNSLLSDRHERAAAKKHWLRVISEMTELETLSAANGHAVQRLVLAYIVYDRCSKAVARGGLVESPSEDNPRAISRISIHYKAMSEAEKTAERLEAQLGLSPQRRAKVGKVGRKRERSTGADRFLGSKD